MGWLGNLVRVRKNPLFSVELERRWPEELEIRVAQNETDLEKAFSLLHDASVREGLATEQPSRLWILPQHLLPQSSIIVALWGGRIVAAVSLIRDNPLLLPAETKQSAASFRNEGKYLAELSPPAYDTVDQDLFSRIQFPLLRFALQCATQSYGVQTLLLNASRSQASFYRDVFSFEPVTRKSGVLFLDLETAPKVWHSLYGKEDPEKNLERYLTSVVNHPGCRLPSRIQSVASGAAGGLIMTPQMLERLYLKKARLLSTLKSEEVRALRDAYPHENFESLLKNISWSEDPSPKRELRIDMQMSARIIESDTHRPAKVNVRNISRHGMQLWHNGNINRDDILTLEVNLGENRYTRIRALVKWTDPAGYCGLRILSYSAEWGELIQAIESQLAKLAASTR